MTYEPSENKCGDCEWLCGRTDGFRIECIQPDKKKKWDAREQGASEWFGREIRAEARFKSRGLYACSKFEKRRKRHVSEAVGV